MPRQLKRRSEAISRDQEESDEQEQPRRQTQAQAQSQRHRSVGSASQDVSEGEGADGQTTQKTLIKKVVRLALSSEYARKPLRKTEISELLKSSSANGRSRDFKPIFNGAQKTLRDIFGMELVDLPKTEKIDMNTRRKVASQKATQAATQKSKTQDIDALDSQGRKSTKDPISSANNWILVSTLPDAYKVRQELLVPAMAPDQDTEAIYTAICNIIVAILYLHTPSGGKDEESTEPISDTRLLRHLQRLGLREFAPTGPGGSENIDKLFKRLESEGYITKRKDNSTGEELIEYVVGPRGKREIGREGAARFVRAMYGFGLDGRGPGLQQPSRADGEDEEERRPLKVERDELERKLKRTLGDVVALKIDNSATNGIIESDVVDDGGGGRRARTAQATSARRSGRLRRNDDEDE